MQSKAVEEKKREQELANNTLEEYENMSKTSQKCNIYAMCFWHSEGMSTRNEELLETVSMLGVSNSGTTGCDAHKEPEE